ncbi:MAG: helix-turn-helix transcriptional regulator [Gemmatimonas sp.]
MPRIRMQKSSGNVFLDMGIPRAKAVHLQIRSQMMIELTRLIEKNDLTQKAAAKLMGVTQPRVSDLVRGNIDVFSIDTLIEMLDCFDVTVTVTTRKRRRRAA